MKSGTQISEKAQDEIQKIMNELTIGKTQPNKQQEIDKYFAKF